MIRTWDCKGHTFAYDGERVLKNGNDITDNWWKGGGGKPWLPIKSTSLKGITKQYLDDE